MLAFKRTSNRARFLLFSLCLCSGISSILFETRLGCLQEEIPADTLRFIAAVNDMLMLSEPVLFFPRWTRGILPFWRRFVQAWDDLIDVGMNDLFVVERVYLSRL